MVRPHRLAVRRLHDGLRDDRAFLAVDREGLTVSALIAWIILTPTVLLIPAALGYDEKVGWAKSLVCSFLVCLLPWWAIYFLVWRPL
jgi:hypothetical protein